MKLLFCNCRRREPWNRLHIPWKQQQWNFHEFLETGHRYGSFGASQRNDQNDWLSTVQYVHRREQYRRSQVRSWQLIPRIAMFCVFQRSPFRFCHVLTLILFYSSRSNVIQRFVFSINIFSQYIPYLFVKMSSQFHAECCTLSPAHRTIHYYQNCRENFSSFSNKICFSPWKNIFV